jgi:transcriptional regulator with XRE-family HTH domain
VGHYKEPLPDAPYRCFGQRLQQALNLKGWLIKDLMGEMNKQVKSNKFQYSQIQNWLQGRHLPKTVADLMLLKKVLGQSMDWLLCMEENAEQDTAEANPMISIIKNREKYQIERRNAIINTTRSLWIQLRTAYFLEENAGPLTEIMSRGVRVRVLACDPDDSVAMEMIARRDYPMHPNASSAAKKIRGAFESIQDDMKADKIDDQYFKIKVISYFPSTAIYLSDPCTGSGKLFAVTAFYKIDPYHAPVVLANEKQHPVIFESYRRQFMLLWRVGKRYEQIGKG